MKLLLKLYSPIMTIELERSITFNKIIVRKIRFRITETDGDCLLINIHEFTPHDYHDGFNKITYTTSLLIPDNNDRIVYRENETDKADFICNDYEQTICYLKISIKNTKNEYETSITLENTLLLEIEFI
jgi:hypothetical protein